VFCNMYIYHDATSDDEIITRLYVEFSFSFYSFCMAKILNIPHYILTQ